MMKYFGIAQDSLGNVLTGASISVKLAGTANDATLYSDNSYTNLANPFTNNSDGSYQFYASNGRYDVVITKAGYTFLAATTSDGTLYDPSSVISPAQITADQNDYNPTNAANATFWRINSDAQRSITGIVSGKSGQRIILANVGSFDILLSNQSASSAAANRIITGTGAAITLSADTQRELWYDPTTSRWRVLGTIVGLSGTYSIRGLIGANNTATPTTQFDMSADLVVLRNTTDGATVTRTNTGTLTNNISTAGSAANGRDQAGAFAASTWLHFYFIWNGSTLATLSSTTAPPTGPSLPSGYTYWAYAGAAYHLAASTLAVTRWQGSRAIIPAQTIRALAAGTGAEETFSLTATSSQGVPPNHIGATMWYLNTGSNVQGDLRIASSGQVIWSSTGNANVGGVTSVSLDIPVVSRTLYFIGGAGTSHVINLHGWKMPNGGD